jgi:plasmid stabilization system protein ParE
LVRLSAAAEADVDAIIGWTAEYLGDARAHTYAKTLVAALRDLNEGPALSGAAERNEVAKGLFSLHVGQRGRTGHHVMLFRLGTDEERLCIDVLCVLHEAMDLQRPVPDAD